ncbi:MAG: glycosyltransferase, partial [Chloroflexi bacterium]|nr:glycosyltransferase [Chloroflexota bacterium]
MKILMVIDNGRIGGAQKLLLSLLPPLQDRGFQFLVIILGQGQWLANALEEAHIPVKVLGLSRWDPRAVWYLWKEVRAFHPDVIHAH